MKTGIIFLGKNEEKNKELKELICDITKINVNEYRLYSHELDELTIKPGTDPSRSELYSKIKNGIQAVDLNYLDKYIKWNSNHDFNTLEREYIADEIILIPGYAAFVVIGISLKDRL